MAEPVSPLVRLGREVASVQDRRAEPIVPSVAALRLTTALAVPRTRTIRRRAAVALLALAAVAAVALSFVGRSSPPLTFARAGAEGRVGEWMAPAPGVELPLAFSDGSVVTLAPAARARVASVEATGAVLVLERGELDVAVVHRPGTRWRIELGPFTVDVTGTRFSLSWKPETEALRLRLDEGSTRVTGPGLGVGRVLAPGEILEVGGAAPATATPSSGATVPTPASGAPSIPIASSSASSAATATGAPGAAIPRPAPSAAAPGASDVPAQPAWRDLAAAGSYGAALRRAQSEGFEALCEKLDVADLAMLGDTARLAADVVSASKAYLALRRRFPASPAAASAAFMLGRLALDQSAAPDAAVRWFRAYLTEAPSGAFAREATGRLMEALERSGDPAGAKTIARRYVEAWPTGPLADRARVLLEAP